MLIGITVATAIVHLVVGGHRGRPGRRVAHRMDLPGRRRSRSSASAPGRCAATSSPTRRSARREKTGRSAIFAVGVAFFLAELGDKTMLATITLATKYGWFGTWLGSTLGMVAADALAILVGRLLGRHLPERTIRYGAAVLFAICGLWLILEAVRELS